MRRNLEMPTVISPYVCLFDINMFLLCYNPKISSVSMCMSPQTRSVLVHCWCLYLNRAVNKAWGHYTSCKYFVCMLWIEFPLSAGLAYPCHTLCFSSARQSQPALSIKYHIVCNAARSTPSQQQQQHNCTPAQTLRMSRGKLCATLLPHAGILHIFQVPALAPGSAHKNAEILRKFWHQTTDVTTSE